jgi:hypothetical protein
MKSNFSSTPTFIPITGATSSTYVINSSLIGMRLSVQVTGMRAGYVARTAVSAQTISAVTASLPFVTTTPPAVSGTAAVGQTLTASIPGQGWSPTPTAVTYEWFSRRSPTGVGTYSIGTGPSYTLQSKDRGHQILVRATGSRAGYTTTTIGSPFTPAVVSGLSFTSVGSGPTIEGVAAVGQTLTAKFSEAGWNPAPTTFTYEWLTRSSPTGVGTYLAGSGPTYTVKSADRGSQILVRVTGSRAGYISSVVTSSFTTAVVSGLATSTSLSANVTTPFVGQEVTFTARISSSQTTQLAGHTVQFRTRASSSTSLFTTLGTAVTDSNGVAVLRHTYTSAQSPQVFGQLMASGPLMGSSSSAVTMSVRSVAFATSLTAGTSSAVVGQEVTFTARVTASQVVPLSGQTVRFQSRVTSPSLIVITLGTALTDANGVATFRHRFTSAQSPQVFAEFVPNGTTTLASSSATTMTITKSTASATISASTTSSVARAEVTFTARITSSQGIAVSGQTIQFKVKVDGSGSATLLGTATTDSNGVATITHAFETAQSAQVFAELSSSASFNDALSSDVLVSVSATVSGSSLYSKESLGWVVNTARKRVS